MNFEFVAGLFLLLNMIHPSVQDKGSTPNIKEIMMGRCYEYQYKQNLAPRKDCNKIWFEFQKAFANKEPCALKSADYEPFFREVGMQEIPKSMFWSDTYRAAHGYSENGLRCTTLEDTFVGFLVNGLTWCGKKKLPTDVPSDGINYVSCPDWKACDYTTPFWGLASKTFAEHARGVVQVMLNGSRLTMTKGILTPVPAYKPDSFFGRFELPNLQVAKITELRILLIHTIEEVKFEAHCGRPSLTLLMNEATKRGIKARCTEDPEDVRHILCADYPRSESSELTECVFRWNKQIETTKKKP